MPRVRMPRFVFVLAVLLVALQFLGVIAPGSSGPSGSGSASASLDWSTTAVVADRADEFADRADVGQLADPTCRLAGRDRHRPAARPDTKPTVDGARGTGWPRCLPAAPRLRISRRDPRPPIHRRHFRRSAAEAASE